MSRATVRAVLADADRVAAALRPDDTGSIATRVEDGAVVATIDRPTTAGLRATVDDHLVNLALARAVGDAVDRRGQAGDSARPADRADRPAGRPDDRDATDHDRNHHDTTP